ncbi:MAG: G5 domain-containing protein [Clostridia bacterium]|nr:G5 domain-containing protein [Clostridia bacterium]
MIQNHDGRHYLGKRVAQIVLSVLLIVVCALSLAAAAYPGYTVDVNADGKSQTVRTFKRNAYAIVDQAGVKMGNDDYLDQSNFRYGANAHDGNELNVLRAFPIRVTVDGKTFETKIAKGTVEDVLDKMNITLGEHDIVAPAKNAAVDENTKIKVSRVTFKERTENEEIPFDVVTKKSDKLSLGTTKTEQEGKKGSKDVTYRDRYIDGVLADTEKIAEKVLVDPIDSILLKGTKSPNGVPADVANRAVRVIRGKSTAYTAPKGSRTASGLPVARGRVAVNPKQIPYGTKLYIVTADGSRTYGYAVAADTGGFAKRGSAVVDLFMDTQAECQQWGARQVVIYVLG